MIVIHLRFIKGIKLRKTINKIKIFDLDPLKIKAVKINKRCMNFIVFELYFWKKIIVK